MEGWPSHELASSNDPICRVAGRDAGAGQYGDAGHGGSVRPPAGFALCGRRGFGQAVYHLAAWVRFVGLIFFGWHTA